MAGAGSGVVSGFVSSSATSIAAYESTGDPEQVSSMRKNVWLRKSNVSNEIRGLRP